MMTPIKRSAPQATRAPDDDRFGTLPRAARIFVASTIAVGCALAAVHVASLSFEQVGKAGIFAEMLALALITSTVKLSLPLSKSGSSMSLSYAISMTSLLVLDAHQAFLINVASAWSQCTFNMKARNALFRTFFSMATVGIAIQGAAWTLAWTRGEETGFLMGIVRPLAPAVTVYFVINSMLVAAAVSLTTRDSLRAVWFGNFVWSAPGYFAGGAAAAVASLAAKEGNFLWSLLVAIPLYLTYQSYRLFIARIEDEQAQVRRLSEVQLATIEALALAIEVKDHTSQAHVRRVQVYCEGLGTAVGMKDDEVRGLKTAALLHDIGNLAVPEDILTKPGPLSTEEFQRVKIHPRVGAEILQAVPFPYAVAPLILAHHEHWDGSGYPNGLTADQIPLGARVLAVVDLFTALLTDRPYRLARSHDEAISVLRQEAGRKLDPTLVDRFILMLPQLNAALDVEGPPSTAAAATQSESGPRALEDIAGAHREARALYEIAQALGSSLQVDETFALIADKLQLLLPLSCSALFLRDERTGQFQCALARGVDEAAVRQSSVVDDTAAVALPGGTHASRLRSVISSPLVLNDRVVGVLATYDVRVESYAAEHRRILERIAQRAAPVIYNALIFEETQTASMTDSLTGLLNRRGVQAHIEEAIARARETSAPLAVLLLDLDGLKYLNDNFGHHAGDRALRLAALALRGKLGGSDICARYAGDEFVVVLPGQGSAQAEERRQILQRAVDATSLDLGDDRVFPLAISAGASVFPDDGITFDNLIEAADSRMYQDKAARKAVRSQKPGTDGALDVAV